MLYIIFLPLILLIVFTLIDMVCDSDVERYKEHCELMSELEQQALDAEARHIERMQEREEFRQRIIDERKELMEEKNKRRTIRRRERKVVHNSDGSYIAEEVTEEEI